MFTFFTIISLRLKVAIVAKCQLGLSHSEFVFHYLKFQSTQQLNESGSGTFAACHWLHDLLQSFLCLYIHRTQHRLNVSFALWLLKLYDNFPLHFTRPVVSHCHIDCSTVQPFTSKKATHTIHPKQ